MQIDLTAAIVGVCFLVFFNCIYPVIDALCSMATSAINKKVHSWQCDMQVGEAITAAQVEDITGNCCDSKHTNCIGFDTGAEQDYYEVEG